jgi:hypothetical protein
MQADWLDKQNIEVQVPAKREEALKRIFQSRFAKEVEILSIRSYRMYFPMRLTLACHNTGICYSPLVDLPGLP